MANRWSKVIKDMGHGVSVEQYDMVDLEAERLAQEEAAKTPALPHDCSSLQQEAFEAGVQAGIQQGQAQVRRETEAEVSRALELVVQVEHLREEAVRQAESDIVELALAIAKKIIHRDTDCDRDIIVSQVRAILGCMAEKGLIHVRVNPAEVAYLEGLRPTFVGSDGKPVRLHVEGDESIHRGGGIVESSQYFIDATIEQQLEEVWQGMIEHDARPDPTPSS